MITVIIILIITITIMNRIILIIVVVPLLIICRRVGCAAQSDRPTVQASGLSSGTFASPALRPAEVRIGAANGRMQCCRIHGRSEHGLKEGATEAGFQKALRLREPCGMTS